VREKSFNSAEIWSILLIPTGMPYSVQGFQNSAEIRRILWALLANTYPYATRHVSHFWCFTFWKLQYMQHRRIPLADGDLNKITSLIRMQTAHQQIGNLMPHTHRRCELNCRVELCRPCVRNSQLVGDSLDESEQICQQRSRVASCRQCERTHRQSSRASCEFSTHLWRRRNSTRQLSHRQWVLGLKEG